MSKPRDPVARAWKSTDPLLSYPEVAGEVSAEASLRFLDKHAEMDLTFKVAGEQVGWTIDVVRAALVGTPSEMAKSFSSAGTRLFSSLYKGVPAREMSTSLATAVEPIDMCKIEYGLQTEDRHEYFLSKSGELAGQLIVERDVSVADKHPWIATLVSSNIIPTAMIKGAPMPPDGISGLPLSIEKTIDPSFRYWEMSGSAAVSAREALRSVGALSKGSIAIVDGVLERVVTSTKLYEDRAHPPLDPTWSLAKVQEILPIGRVLSQALFPLNKAQGAGEVLYVDAGLALEGTVDLLAASLIDHAGDFVVTASDAPSARKALSKLGSVFRFRPGGGAGPDALAKIFVASFGVRGDVEWIGKASIMCVECKRSDATKEVLWAGGRAVAKLCEKCTKVWNDPDAVSGEGIRREVARVRNLPAVYTEPSDDHADLGKAFDPVEQMAAAGPPNEWSGGVAGLFSSEQRRQMKDAWATLNEQQKEGLLSRFYANFTKRVLTHKAEWSTAYVNDLPDSAFLVVSDGGKKDGDGKTVPRSLRHFPVRDHEGNLDPAHVRNAIARIPQSDVHGKSELQDRARSLLEGKAKADMVTGGPGTLQPAVSNPTNRRRQKVDDIIASICKVDDGDERFVYGIVLEPETVDKQNDIYSADEVRDACHKYMASFQNIGLMHRSIINAKADVLECYISPTDFAVGSTKVKKGTWLMAIRAKDDGLWNDIKSGKMTGFSIGGSARRTPDPKAEKKYATRKAASLKSLEFQGIKIDIDRPKGFVQEGKDEEGKPWSRTYSTDYGFIPSTDGGDGEELDVFVGPNAESPFAYWVKQKKSDGSFDEYKLFVGYDSPVDAKKVYEEHVPKRFFDSIVETSIGQVKALLNQRPHEDLAKALRSLS